MKQRILLLFAVLVGLGYAVAQPSHSSDQDAATEITSLADEEYAAYFRGDTAVMRRIEGVDFVVVGPDGKSEPNEGRYEGIERKVKAGQWFSAPVVTTKETRGTQVFGESAVVHGIMLEKQGGELARVAYTEAWVKREGHWKFVYLAYHPLQ
jgi:hypothetical protein